MKAKSPNVPEYWDSIWSRNFSDPEVLHTIARWETGVSWMRLEEIVTKTFGGFQGLRVIEIGAGQGMAGVLMAKRGASVTILDFSEESLSNSQKVFASLGLKAEFVLENALSIRQGLKRRFDIAMSWGLAEHFTGVDRKGILNAHFQLLTNGGLAVISVPNKWNPPYRLYKWLAELKGSWPVEEYPFSRLELQALMRESGVTDCWFFGDSLFASASWLYSLTYKVNPFVLWRRIAGKPDSFDASRTKRYPATPLDEYFSYALVLCARQNSAEPAYLPEGSRCK